MPENANKKILMVDDDRRLCALVKDYLEPMGFHVTLCHDGAEGLLKAKNGSYDAVMLDVMMPVLDGFEVLRELRKFSDVPVLMLTALGDEADRIVGLEMGADDYLPKTFSTRELLARLRAVTRRGKLETPRAVKEMKGVLTAADITVDIGSHVVTRKGEVIEMTALEFSILVSLMTAKGRVKSREALVVEVAERKFDVYDRSIDVHVSGLRKKLGDDPKAPRFIRTVRGVGYLFGEAVKGDIS